VVWAGLFVNNSERFFEKVVGCPCFLPDAWSLRLILAMEASPEIVPGVEEKHICDWSKIISVKRNPRYNNMILS
jgi:hypothetical protein